MFCTNCGQTLESNDNFCGQCGKAVRRAKVPQMAQTQIRKEQPTYQAPSAPRQPEYVSPQPIPPRNKTAESKAEKKREEMRAELKELLENERGREITNQELLESESWLRGYAEVILDAYLEDKDRQKKLEENPKGFHLEGQGYTCFICINSVSNDQTWYDKYGIKCLTCQSAIDKKIIPASAASDKDSWYSLYDLEHSFFINRHGVRRFVKEGLLKPRVVPNSARGVHYQLFFIKDHKGILPPKELTKWPTVKFQKDGQDWYHSDPWFQHADPREVLKGYKILEYLQTLKEKEITESFPELSFQLSKGAKSIMEVDYIENKNSFE